MNRKSMSANTTPAGTPRKNGRQSLPGLDKSDIHSRLYEAIIKDPQKRAMVLQLLSEEKHLIKDYLRKEGKTPVKGTRALYCESPTALFKRKLMEKKQGVLENDSSTSSDDKSVVPSPVPFEKLLEGVIAFVEVKTKSGDRSSATKAVIASMGATVREQLTKDVTHVIFKDGSYSTYQKGKLIKAHIVSLLWIEAVRKNHARVPEKDFPALGTEAFNANLSVLCQQMQQEYEEALQDEVNQTLNSSTVSPEHKRVTRRVTDLPTQLFSASKVSNSFNGLLRRQTMQNLSEENQSFISSDSSDCMIDGEITRKIIQDLDLSTPENTVMKSVENIDSSKRKSDSFQTLDTSNNNTGDTSNGSTSLLDIKKLQTLSAKRKSGRKSKENQSVDMELTGNAGDMLKVTTANKPVPKELPKRKKGSSKQRLFAETSTDSDVTQLTNSVTAQQAVDNKSSSDMSSLKLSASNNSKTQKTDSFDGDSKKSPPKTSGTAEQKTISDSDSTFPSLRLSSETEKEINSEFVTVRKEKRKPNFPIKSGQSPPKISKPESSTQDSATKKTAKRKLYNPDEDLDGSNLREKDDSIINKKTNITFKKPTIALTPVLLTTRAKRFLEEKKDKEPITKSQTTPKSSTQTKVRVTRTAKSTTKKAAATQNPVEEREERKKRSSSFYFDKTPIKNTQRKLKKTTSVVCTRLHKPEVQMFEQIAKRLGGFFVEDEVTSSTSHLVAGEAKRTINLLRALARGCWILRHEWVLKSLEAGKWLPEEEYELTEFSTAVQRCRIERQAFGPSYSMDIFRDCGYIYVARSTIPRCSDLQELIKICKGKVTAASGRAKIIVGERIDGDGVVCVKETWILDSIAENKLKPIKNYFLEDEF